MTNADLWLSAAVVLCLASATAGAALWRAQRRAQGRVDGIVRAWADALFPKSGPIPISGGDAGAVQYMRRYLARSRAPQRRLIQLLIFANEYMPLLFGPRRRRFTRLTLAEQQAVIEDGYASPIYLRRVVVLTMRCLLTMAYFDSDAVMRHLGMRHDADPFNVEADHAPPPLVSGERLKPGFASDDDALTG